MKLQEDCFKEQLRLAREMDLPVVIHSRGDMDIQEKTYRMIKEVI